MTPQPPAGPIASGRPGWVTVALLVILTAAVAVRGLYLGEVAAEPEYLSPGVDAGFHDYWARALVTSDWTPPPGTADPHTAEVPFVRPPGYPYFLAGVYTLFGVHPLPVRLIQMALGVLSCALAFFIGRRAFDPLTGLLWSAGMCAYWGFTYFDLELHAEAPAGFLLLLAMWLLLRWRERGGVIRPVLAGIVFGTATLLRPNLLPLVALAALWMCWVRRDRTLRRRLLAAAALAGAALAAIAPATIRNYRVSGAFVLVSANGGINLYIGNNPAAQGYAAGQLEGYGRFHTPHDYPALVRAVEREVGHPVSYAEASRHFARRAVAYAAEHPLHTLELLGVKTLLFWGPMEIPNNRELNCARLTSPTLSRLPLTFPRMLPVALAGIVLAAIRLRRRPADGPQPPAGAAMALALLMIAGIFLTVLPFFVAGRYRLPMVPLLLMFAAIAVRAWIQWIGERRWGRAALAAGGVLALHGLVSTQWVGPEPDWGRWRLDRGLAYARIDELAPAIDEYRKALAFDPQNVNLRLAAAHALRRLERYAEAETVLLPVVEQPGPYFSEAQIMLAQIVLREERPEDALFHYRAAIATDPYNLQARREIVWLLNVLGRHEEAVSEIEALLELDPTDAETRLFYGLTLRSLHREPAAQEQIDAALRQQPQLRTKLPPQ